LGGGRFTGTPVASSWGQGRFDIWAAGATDGQLYHLIWDGSAYQGWEALGGSFMTAPTVAHWDIGKIDIVGIFDASDNMHYHSKSYDGLQWNPSLEGWYDKGGDFAGQPAIVVNKGTSKFFIFPVKRFRLFSISFLFLPRNEYSLSNVDFLYILGVANSGKVELQLYDGYSWQPSSDRYWELGDTLNPYPMHSTSNIFVKQLEL
jgi:hypothetical protein